MNRVIALPNSAIGLLIVLACIFIAAGCDDDQVVGPDPHVPFVPSDPVPFERFGRDPALDGTRMVRV